MKALNTLAGLALAAYVVLALGACSKTDNGSTAAATPALAYGCSGYTYSNGYYYPPTGGAPIPASSCTGSYGGYPTGVPGYGYTGGTGYGGGTYMSGCQQWSYYYNTVYVPVNIGGGQLVCVNYQYLSSMYNFSGYGGGMYTDPNYWYQYPPMAYQGGYYGGYGYNSCMNNVSLGFSGGDFGAGVSLCF